MSLKDLFSSFLNKNEEQYEKIQEMRQRGAILLDVRMPAEFASGHVDGSINIPVQDLSSRVSELDLSKAILVYCASGMRSAKAKQLLENFGATEVYNAKTWINVKQALDAS